MKKGILEFDRDDHYENLAFIRAFNADNAYSALFQIRESCFKADTMDQETLVKRIFSIIEDKVNLDNYE